MLDYYMLLDLQRFAEGGDGGASDGGAGDNGQEAAAPVNPRARVNPLANIKFGRQEAPESQAAADDNAAQATAPAETFQELIKGRHKADFDAEVQKILRGRLRESKATEDRLSKANAVMQIIGEQYGLDVSDPNNIDIDGLTKALSEDKRLYEAEGFLVCGSQ